LNANTNLPWIPTTTRWSSRAVLRSLKPPFSLRPLRPLRPPDTCYQTRMPSARQCFICSLTWSLRYNTRCLSHALTLLSRCSLDLMLSLACSQMHRWGPSSSHWIFPFEHFGGSLKRYVKPAQLLPDTCKDSPDADPSTICLALPQTPKRSSSFFAQPVRIRGRRWVRM
jgi:hypothetical protein